MALVDVIMYLDPPFTSVPPPNLTTSRRERDNDRSMPPPTSIPRKRKIAPRETSSPEPSRSRSPSEASRDNDNEDDAADVDAPYTARKRPTKTKGKLNSREAQRKANHSLIERRRREKINAALGELREMVPGLGDDAKGGEFKLEVLERTVAHMRELKDELALLKARETRGARDDPPAYTNRYGHRNEHGHVSRLGSGSGSGTGTSGDADETESEPGLPPPLAFAARPRPTVSSASSSASKSSDKHAFASPSHPSLASLLSSAPPPAPTRPLPPPQAPNPTLYLPLPTPSPTSPFLSYSSSTSTSTGPTEPSPFIAPLQGMSLFGGAMDGLTPHLGASIGIGRKVQGDEEHAANLLLAFSSPDVMRPTVMGMTPLHHKGDDFSLDGNSNGAGYTRSKGLDGPDARWSRDHSPAEAKEARTQGTGTGQGVGVRGKTARDILEM